MSRLISSHERRESSFHCEHNLFVEIFYCQIIVSLNQKINPFDCCFLVSYQPRFHAALFKYIFRSTKVDFVISTLMFVLLKQAETKVMNKRSVFDSKTLNSFS